MKRKVSGFHQDEENHWVADLECGHKQHVRHDPPMVERDWVLSAKERASRVGVMELNCLRCDEAFVAARDECVQVLIDAYEEAGISGLCGEGRWEYAIDRLRHHRP